MTQQSLDQKRKAKLAKRKQKEKTKAKQIRESSLPSLSHGFFVTAHSVWVQEFGLVWGRNAFYTEAMGGGPEEECRTTVWMTVLAALIRALNDQGQGDSSDLDILPRVQRALEEDDCYPGRTEDMFRLLELAVMAFHSVKTEAFNKAVTQVAESPTVALSIITRAGKGMPQRTEDLAHLMFIPLKTGSEWLMDLNRRYQSLKEADESGGLQKEDAWSRECRAVRRTAEEGLRGLRDAIFHPIPITTSSQKHTYGMIHSCVIETVFRKVNAACLDDYLRWVNPYRDGSRRLPDFGRGSVFLDRFEEELAKMTPWHRCEMYREHAERRFLTDAPTVLHYELLTAGFLSDWFASVEANLTASAPGSSRQESQTRVQGARPKDQVMRQSVQQMLPFDLDGF